MHLERRNRNQWGGRIGLTMLLLLRVRDMPNLKWSWILLAVAGCGGGTTLGTTGPGGASGSGGGSAGGNAAESSGAPNATSDSGSCSLPPSRRMGTEGSECCSSSDCYFYPAWCQLPAACIDGRCGPCDLAPADTGTGGTAGADAGSASPGRVHVDFTATGAGSYCAPACPGPAIGIEDSSGRRLVVAESCIADCETCAPANCIQCPAIGVGVTGAQLDWDGTYYTTSTCGSGTSCARPTFAKPGRYTATFCATPGTLVGPDGGIQQCVNTGPEKCGSVDFNFPSNTVVEGTVGP